MTEALEKVISNFSGKLLFINNSKIRPEGRVQFLGYFPKKARILYILLQQKKLPKRLLNEAHSEMIKEIQSCVSEKYKNSEFIFKSKWEIWAKFTWDYPINESDRIAGQEKRRKLDLIAKNTPSLVGLKPG